MTDPNTPQEHEAPADGIAKDLVHVPMVGGDDGVAHGSGTVVGDGTGTHLPDADPSTIGPDSVALNEPTLAGSYRVIHGSFTLVVDGERTLAARGETIVLTHDEAASALANGTVEPA